MKCRPTDQEPTNRPGVLAGVVSDRRGSATAYGATCLPSYRQAWDTITLSLPPDTAMPVPVGRWQRQDGRILATYTPEELTLSVQLALEEKQHHLQTHLERELDVLAASTGCDDAEAERLLARWDALNAEHTATVTALAAVSQSVNSENPALKDQ